MKYILSLCAAAGLLLALYSAIAQTRLVATRVLIISDLTQSDSRPKIRLNDAEKEQLKRRFMSAQRDWLYLEMFGYAVSAAGFAGLIAQRLRSRRVESPSPL